MFFIHQHYLPLSPLPPAATFQAFTHKYIDAVYTQMILFDHVIPPGINNSYKSLLSSEFEKKNEKTKSHKNESDQC